MRTGISVFVGIVLVLAPSAPSVAHHAQAPFFDQNKTVEVRGIVKNWLFRNPHPVLTVEAQGKDGSKQTWEIQFPPATVLSRRGWTAETFKSGQEVVATGHPSRAEGTFGLEYRTITWGDGSPIR